LSIYLSSERIRYISTVRLRDLYIKRVAEKIYIRNFFCFRDRVPTVLVKEWPLVCTMFNGDSIMGPVPTLFAENIEVIIYTLYPKQIL
jgi:hypothetical protein